MICFRPSPFLARISYWPRASASSLAKMADGLALGLDAAFGGLGLGLDLDLGLFGLGRGFQLGPPLGLDPLGLGQGRLGHGQVLGFQHGGLGLALAGLAQFDRPRPASPASAACERGDVGLGQVLAFDRLWRRRRPA